MRRHFLTLGLTLLIIRAVFAQTDSSRVFHLNPGDVTHAQIDFTNSAGSALFLDYRLGKRAEFTRIVGDNVNNTFPTELNAVPVGRACFFTGEFGDFLSLPMSSPAAALRAAELVLNPKPPKLEQIVGGAELDLSLNDAQAGLLKFSPENITVVLESVSDTQCAAWNRIYNDNLGKPINIRICGKVVSHVTFTQPTNIGRVEFPVATLEDGLADIEKVVPPYKPGRYRE